MLNEVRLIGRTSKSSTLNNGCFVFDIATSKTWVDNQGVRQERTQWVRCHAFGNLAVAIAAHTEGLSRLLFVGGEFVTSKYTNAQGYDQYSTYVAVNEFKFLDNAPVRNNTPARPATNSRNIQMRDNEVPSNIPEECLPF